MVYKRGYGDTNIKTLNRTIYQLSNFTLQLLFALFSPLTSRWGLDPGNQFNPTTCFMCLSVPSQDSGSLIGLCTYLLFVVIVSEFGRIYFIFHIHVLLCGTLELVTLVEDIVKTSSFLIEFLPMDREWSPLNLCHSLFIYTRIKTLKGVRIK